MEPVHYLRALRQWWHVILVLTLVGVISAALLTKTPPTSYQATHTLVLDSENTNAVTLSRAAFLVTNGEVPRRVAAALGSEPGVDVVTDGELNGLQITATSANPDRAVEIADAYAKQLVAVLDARAAENYSASLENAKKAVTDAVAALVAAGPNAPDSLQNRVDDARTALQDLESQGSPTAGFSTIGTTAVSSAGGGTSRVARILIGGLVGFLLGVFAALVLARFDTRIRTKEGAEQAFEAPVLAEVPLLRRRLRGKRAIVTIADPESLAAESYRGLRTALLVTGAARARPPVRRRPAPAPPTGPGDDASRVVMVVSPGMGEGKTTTTANLAVALAEAGRSVLVLGCDLRRPELHNYFGLSEGPGLTELLASQSPERSLEWMIRDTNVRGVRMVTSGHPIDHPGELLTQGLELLKSARGYADVVVVDTAPLLATDDASVLVPLVDDVVLVCRAGLTPKDAGQRARELLARLQAPVLGTVLIGAQQVSSARSYYRSDYRSHKPSAAGAPDDAATARLAPSAADMANGATPAPGGSGGASGDAGWSSARTGATVPSTVVDPSVASDADATTTEAPGLPDAAP